MISSTKDELFSKLQFKKIENGPYSSDYKNAVFDIHYVICTTSKADSDNLNLSTEIVYCAKHNERNKIEKMIEELEEYHHFKENGVNRIEVVVVK